MDSVQIKVALRWGEWRGISREPVDRRKCGTKAHSRICHMLAVESMRADASIQYARARHRVRRGPGGALRAGIVSLVAKSSLRVVTKSSLWVVRDTRTG